MTYGELSVFSLFSTLQGKLQITEETKETLAAIKIMVYTIKMPAIPFTVSARTAKLIGVENFSNAGGAIIELIKNAYDADAKTCLVIFENSELKPQYEQQKHREDKTSSNYNIYIIDDGSGMSKEVLENQWMTIGTDDKLINYQSDHNRIKTGAKGIGRFALNRLGKTTELYTIPENTLDPSAGYSWTVDWQGFDKAGATINEVTADLELVNPLSLKDILLTRFQEDKQIVDTIKGLSFQHGTIIKITSLNDDWDDNSISKIFSDLELLIPPKEQPFFDIFFFDTAKENEYGLVPTAYYDDYDYKVRAEYLADGEKTVEISITRNELDLERLSREFSGLFKFDKMGVFPYRLEDFKAKTIQRSMSINRFKGFPKNVDQDILDNIGKFSFTFYFVKNIISDDRKDSELQKYPYKDFSSAGRKAWLKKFSGIKIFRDDFRIRPYGENGDDWLRLGERQAQSPGGAGQRLGGYRIRPNQISGTVAISRIANEIFQDKSGREGIQETPAFELFKNILIEIIHLFEEDRNIVMYYLSQLYKETHKKNDKQKADDLTEKIKKGTKPHENPEQQVQILAKGYAALGEEIEEKEEEIRLLRNLASTGLIISSFAHEFKSIRNRLESRMQILQSNLRRYIPHDIEKTVSRYENPVHMIETMQLEDDKLKHWLNYSINSLRRDKRRRKNIDIDVYFHDFKDVWSYTLTEKNIKLELKNNIAENYSFRGFEVDLDSIFNNLLSNSIYSLSRINNNKKIIIKYSIKDSILEIIFSDNGEGLALEYHNEPEMIFRSFETSRKDKTGNNIGTGLGLYIVKSVINEYPEAFIKIMEYKRGFSLKIGLKTRG